MSTPLNTRSEGANNDVTTQHRFEISLKVLLECLDIFGGASGGKADEETFFSTGKDGGGKRAGADTFLDKRSTRPAMSLTYPGKGEPLIML